MKGAMTAAAMHRQYDEGVSAFRQHIANPAMRQKFNQDVDEFMRQCALGVWQADGGNVSPQHVEYYNGIYCKGNPVPTALYWELCTAVAEYPGFRPPVFFQRMREYDKAYRQKTARRFVDLLTLMLLLFAAADGAVSDREAGFVNACADALTALCDADGLASDKPKLDAGDFVTRRGEDKPGQAAAPAPAGKEEAASSSEPEPEPAESLEELLAQLDGLCGLDRVKKDVRSLINLVKVRRLREEQELPVPPMSLHLVFMGNPGTGKTTVARLLARIYHAIGVLSKGQLVEVDRSGLVAGFVGQTALKTQEVIQKAIGGFYAAMTRTDAVVMTAGIGENSAELRERIFDGLAHMGMILDKERNDVTGQIGVNRIISIDDSPIKICVVTTDEEMRIARETDDLVEQLRL